MLMEPEAPLKDDLSEGHRKEDGADDRVQAEECDIDPVQASAPGNPMFQHKASDDNKPADEVSDAKATEQAESQQQAAHDHVRKKRRLKRVSGSPGNDQRVQPVRAIKLIILQSI